MHLYVNTELWVRVLIQINHLPFSNEMLLALPKQNDDLPAFLATLIGGANSGYHSEAPLLQGSRAVIDKVMGGCVMDFATKLCSFYTDFG